jgi:hypothetical protein
MPNSSNIHPLLIDTDAIIALANSNCWSAVVQNVGLTTTQACRHELQDHRRGGSEFAREGSWSYRRHRGATNALDSLNDRNSVFNDVPCHVSDIHSDSGEGSIAYLLEQHSDEIEAVIMMDSGRNDEFERGGRELVRFIADTEQHGIRFTSPAFPLAVLYQNDLITKEEFCEETGRIIDEEDWTSYSAVKRMWEDIPVDCSGYLDIGVLP